jgi:acylphosphatase
MKKSYVLKVTGRVQNVGFRYFAVKEAEKSGVKGFVRNEPDRSVYIEAEGEEEDLDRFYLRIKKGPMWGRVEHVVLIEQPLRGYDKFIVKY